MKYLPRYLYALAACLFLAGVAVACAPNKAKPTDPVTPTEPRDCDKPSRDDQGRPVDLC